MSAKASPLIVPVFLPHAGCPHQCVFCNQRIVTGIDENTADIDALKTAISKANLDRYSTRRPVQIAFYGGNFLGLPQDRVCAALNAATGFIVASRGDAIRISTRPETISSETVALIRNYPVATVEIGAQSMSEQVLNQSRRGHSVADTQRAVQTLKANGFEVGIQVMVGLPGDDDRTALATGAAIAALQPAFVRIYPTVVLNGSPLARWYAQGRYQPLSLEKAVSLTKQLWTLFHTTGIAVIRMGLQTSPDLENGAAVIAGPFHPAFGHLVHEALFFDTLCAAIEGISHADSIHIRVHPRNRSKLNGLNNQNLRRLINRFRMNQIQVHSDSQVAPDNLIVNEKCVRITGSMKVNGGSA